MNPQSVFCPNPECPARGRMGKGNIWIHSRKDERYQCKVCKRTFRPTQRTPLHLLQTDAATVILVITLPAWGCPPSAIVYAFGFDERTIRQWWLRAGAHCEAVHGHIAQLVKQRLVQGIELSQRIVQGSAAQVAQLPACSKGGAQINTACIERLNATFRQRPAPLARRTRALAKQTETLTAGMWVVGTLYNFCAPHQSLRCESATQDQPNPQDPARWVARTPAMAAGLTDHVWTPHSLFLWRLPPPRWSPPKRQGRPSNVTRRLINEWYS